MDIERKLEYLKRLRGVSQAAAARHAGISPARLSEWKGGSWSPNPPTLLKLARFYDAPMEFFADPEVTEVPAGLTRAQQRAAELVAHHGYTVKDVLNLLSRPAAPTAADAKRPSFADGDVIGTARVERPKRAPRRKRG